jgi:beta-lactam-binding protein with PASTA domain
VDSGVEAADEDQHDGGGDQSSIARLFISRRVLLGVLVVLLGVGVLLVTSRATTSITIPDLVGERVDPQLDVLRQRLAYEGLVLGDVSTATCPTVDVPGTSLEELPGTIIDQRPAAGTTVVTSRAVDVTVCLPNER